MTWVSAVIIGSIFASIRSIQARRVGLSKKNLTSYGLFTSFACVFMLGIVHALVSGSHISSTNALSAWFFIVVGGALFASANFIVLTLYRKLPASAVVMLTLLNIVSVLIISRVFSSETLTTQQWIGAFLLVSSSLLSRWIATPKKNIKKKHMKHLWHYYLLAIAVALMYGFAVVNEKYLLSRIGTPTYLVYGWGAQFIFATLLAVHFGLLREIKTTRENHMNSWLLGILLAASGFFFIQTLTLTGSASITVIGSSMSLVFALVLAHIFLKERKNTLFKLVAVCNAIAGFSLII